MKSSIIKGLTKIARTVFVLAFWVIIWHFIAVKVNLNVLIPRPLDVAARLYELMGTQEFYVIIANSVYRILSGFFTAVLLGLALGIVTAKIKPLDELLSPLLSVIKATPVASFIIITLVWLDKNTIPAFISFLMVLPIIQGNVSEGIKNTPTELAEMTKIFNFSFKHKLTKLYLPCLTPYFFAGIKTSLGLAWKAGVAAEVLAIPKSSIGKELYDAKIYLEATEVFAWTVTVIALSMILENILTASLKRLTAKKKEALQK